MKKRKKDTSNLIFSAFLILAFIVCTLFFNGVIQDSTNLSVTWKTLLTLLIFVVFGLLLFYATRIGDGKQVKRFSLSTLILLDLPTLYIIIASVWSVLPFHTEIAQCNIMVYIASITLGYGIPYTFLSGYELERIEETDDKDIDLNDGFEEDEKELDEDYDSDELSQETEYDLDEILNESSSDTENNVENSLNDNNTEE